MRLRRCVYLIIALSLVLGGAWAFRVSLDAPQRLGMLVDNEGQGVTRVLFSPDGRHLLAEGHDGFPPVFSWGSLRERSGKTHRFPAARLGGFTSDGQHLLTVHEDGPVSLWKVGTWERVPTVKIPSRRGCNPSAAISPDGHWIAWAALSTPRGIPPGVSIWSTTDGKRVAQIDYGFEVTGFSPDSRLVA